MSAAVVGFVGAIAGAIATIGTQGTLGWLQSRNASRTAARLLHGDLLEARDSMVAVVSVDEWKHKRDFAHVVSAWREHREAIARAKAKDFHDVAGAFKAVEFIQIVRDANRTLSDGASRWLASPFTTRSHVARRLA
jgi:hypothetical protein